MSNVFDQMGVYWAEIADKNQTERQIQFLKSQLKPGGRVLDVACGTGRHTVPLKAAGFDMVGLDVSLNLLKIAMQRDPAVQLVRGDIRFLPFKALRSVHPSAWTQALVICPQKRMICRVWLKSEGYWCRAAS